MNIEFGNRPPVYVERMVVIRVDNKRRDFAPEWYADPELDEYYLQAEADPARPANIPIPWWAVKINLETDDIAFTACKLVINNPFRFLGELDPLTHMPAVLEMTRHRDLAISSLIPFSRVPHETLIKKTFFLTPPIDGLRIKYLTYYNDFKQSVAAFLDQ